MAARASPTTGYDVPTVADDLATLIERMGLDRPIAAGQSWGGNVVLELASRHPHAVRAIALVDGGWIELSEGFPKLADCLTALAPPRLAGRPLKEVEGYIRSAHADWPESGIQGTLANFEVRPDGTIAPWLTYDRHLVVLRGLWEHHPATRYAALQVPALLIPAEDDARADWNDRKRPAVEAAQAAIPHARTRWMERRPRPACAAPARGGRAAARDDRRRVRAVSRASAVSAPRLLAIMGSGETAPAMAKVHRALLERLGDPAAPATLLDTPYGFQENADDLTERIVAYFAESVGHALSVATLPDAGRRRAGRPRPRWP